MELIAELNGCKAYVGHDEDGGACNPRTEQDHSTEILFYGARVRASGRDRHVNEEQYYGRLKDGEYYSLDCTEVLGSYPGLACISIYKRDFHKEWGFSTSLAFRGNGATKKKALEVLVSYAKEYELWAGGEVYFYKVENARGETLDECYGFLGEEHVKQAAQDALEHCAKAEPSPVGIPGAVFSHV
jgi:hypothetical protein